MTPIQIHRNIPAYAGKTLCHKALVRTSPEHPRVCGENWVGDQNREAHFGTSPRMRGKPCLRGSAMTYNRNIPAYAGKTGVPRRGTRHEQEHPRVCGENFCVDSFSSSAAGTSPRMRGKPHTRHSPGAAIGNIPAYAGKTEPVRLRNQVDSEHPRVCGENVGGT